MRRALIAALMLIAAPARADGDDYFLRDDGTTPLLRYYGHVTDLAGKPLGGATVIVEIKQPRVLVRATSFPDGGFKAPDLGLYLGGRIDLAALEIRCEKDGYATARLAAAKNQLGAVVLDIVMTPAP